MASMLLAKFSHYHIFVRGVKEEIEMSYLGILLV